MSCSDAKVSDYNRKECNNNALLLNTSFSGLYIHQPISYNMHCDMEIIHLLYNSSAFSGLLSLLRALWKELKYLNISILIQYEKNMHNGNICVFYLNFILYYTLFCSSIVLMWRNYFQTFGNSVCRSRKMGHIYSSQSSWSILSRGLWRVSANVAWGGKLKPRSEADGRSPGSHFWCDL